MGPLTRNYTKLILLLWIQLSVYPCSFAENMNIMCPPNFQPLAVESISNCSIKLSNDSSNFEYALRNRISWEDGTIQRIYTDMKIPNDYKTDENNKMILPNKWLLAYIDPDGPFNFVSWRSDFKVLSLGLLSDENNEPINVKINDTAANCDVEIGGNYMITEIVKLVTNFIREKVELDRPYDYENIHLCYLSKFEWFKESPWYAAKQLFGIPFQEFGYKCCMVRENTVCCDDKLHRVEGYRLFPYFISICIFTYSPILLMSFAIFAKTDDDYKSQKEDNKYSKEVPVCLRFPFFLRYNDYKYFNNTNMTNNKTKLEPKSEPKEYSQESPFIENGNDKNIGCFLSVYNWFSKRLKRITFLLFFPSMIYFEFILLMSDVEWKDLLQTVGKDDLLFGFPTMLGSLKNNFFLPPEGPMGALIMYYLFGFLIIVWPSDFENMVLGQGIEIFGKNTFHIKSSYKKINKILLKYMYLPLDTGYWKSCIYCTPITFLLRLFPIYSFPIIPFSIIALTGWIQYWFNELNVKCNWSSILKIIFVFVLTLVFNIFYGIFVVMLSYSIYLLFYILFFTSLGFIMSPNKQSKILIFIVSAIVFEYQIIRDSIHFYTEIFHLIVAICESDRNLKEKSITYHDNGKCIKEYLVVEVFRKIRPAFVQTGHIIIKTVIVILIYASALTFMIKFNGKISDIFERFSILITSVTPIILQWRLKTVCPKRVRVAQIIRKCVKEAEQKAITAELSANTAEENAKETERKTNEAEQKTREAEEKVREAERITQEAKHAVQNANEAERKAKIYEIKSKEHELEAKKGELNTIKDDLDTKACELNIKEDTLNNKETELNTKETQLGIEKAKLKIEWTELKAQKAIVEKLKRKFMKDNPSIP